MIKQIIIGVSSATLLGLGISAYADNIDYSTPVANNSGFYAGGQLGYDRLHFKNQKINDVEIGKGKNASGFTGRVDGGYAFNQYLSAEMGYTYLGSYDTKLSYINIPKGMTTPYFNLKRRIYAIDAMAKVSYPIGKFFVFGEGGAAYVHTKYTKGSLNIDRVVEKIIVPGDVIENKPQSMIRPKAGLGVGYNLTNNLALDVSYTRIFGTGKPVNVNGGNMNTKYLPNIDMAAVGLTYKF